MPPTKKTDNGNLEAKLALRRHFLELYPPTSVLDCCQGGGKIWSSLLESFPTKYLGVDVKPKKGRLQVDSAKILGQPGWDYDVVDIDTYGSPWRHWANALKFAPGDVTIFLTIGMVKVMGGNTCREVREWLGFDRFDPKIPSSLASKCDDISTPYALDRARRHGFAVELALEAPRSKNARYLGIRLSKCS